MPDPLDMQGRSCRHKQALGMLEAYTKAQKLKREESPGSEGIHPARCRQCGAWFLTTRPWRRSDLWSMVFTSSPTTRGR